MRNPQVWAPESRGFGEARDTGFGPSLIVVCGQGFGKDPHYCPDLRALAVGPVSAEEVDLPQPQFT